MTTPGAGRRPAQAALRDERGTAFLMGLMIVMVMTLLGVALFEMSTIEAGLARSDALEIQAFYCAEAEAARVYALYAPANDPRTRARPATSPPTPRRSRLPMARTSRVPGGGPRVEGGHGYRHLHAAERTHPNRAAQWNARSTPTRSSSSPRPGRGAGTSGDWCFGDPARLGGADSITGDIYVVRQCPSPRRGEGHRL